MQQQVVNPKGDNKGKGKSKAKDNGKGKGGGGKDAKHGKGKSFEPYEPDWIKPAAAAPPEPAPTPAPALSASDQKLQHVLQALKKNGLADSLPAEVQQLMQESEETVSAASNKALHKAVSRLGQAKKTLHQSRAARTMLHTAWRDYLAESVKRWQGFAAEFQAEDQSLEEAITKAAETYQEAKKALEVAQATALEKTTEEIEDISESEAMNTDKEKENSASIRMGAQQLIDTLEQLKNKADQTLEEAAPKRQKVAETPAAKSGAMQPFGGGSR